MLVVKISLLWVNAQFEKRDSVAFINPAKVGNKTNACS